MRYLAAFLLGCLVSPGATVDRIAVTAGSAVITELQIDEDLRVAALLNGQAINRDLESRRAAADRLVQQMLIQHEIQLSRYPAPSAAEVDTLFSKLEETAGGSDNIKQKLVKYNVSEQTLRAHLTAQLVTLRFIEFRFAPDINITDGEIERAYRQSVESSHAANPTAHVHPLDANERTRLSQFLLEERIDAALNSWLAESRKQVNILYIDSTLQ